MIEKHGHGGWSRRRFVWGMVAGAGTIWAGATARSIGASMRTGNGPEQDPTTGRLKARPKSVRKDAPDAAGVRRLGGKRKREHLLHVPAGYSPRAAAPLVVMLHGAGGSAPNILEPFTALADELGLLVLAPSSAAMSWDMMSGGLGPDVAALDDTLGKIFEDYAVDPRRLGIGGFSDGASYALTIGTVNGDLFSHIIAFSPGYMTPPSKAGSPGVYVSHGTRDRILPIDACSRKIVPALRAARYQVDYQEFDGGHTVPPAVARRAMEWFSRPA